MITDDTRILVPGNWEAIIVAAGESRPAVDSMTLPLLEVTRGMSERVQFTAVAFRQVLEERGQTARSGLGEAQLEAKWRFFEQGAWSASTALAYAFPMSRSARIRGLIEDVRILTVPLIGSYYAGRLELTASVQFDWTSKSYNGVGYGAYAAYGISNTVNLLLEVYGEDLFGGTVEDKASVTNWRTGFTWQFTPEWSLLAAGGGSLVSDLEPDEQLDYDWYLGLQYNTR